LLAVDNAFVLNRRKPKFTS